MCNVYYKIYSKILTSRLQPILLLLIAENQTSFVPGRAITDNILVTHEIMHILKSSKATKRCKMVVKTDMTKAYGRLEWDFIKEFLQQFGFAKEWIQWVMHSVTTVSYSFLINGKSQGTCHPKTRHSPRGPPFSFPLHPLQ